MPTSDKKPTYQQARKAVDDYIAAMREEAKNHGENINQYAYVTGALSIIVADLLAGNSTLLDEYITD